MSLYVGCHTHSLLSPLYNDDGYVVGTDSAGSLVSDLTSFLDECAANNILAGLVLFNGAVLRNKEQFIRNKYHLKIFKDIRNEY